jgi:hypothetical protein
MTAAIILLFYLFYWLTTKKYVLMVSIGLFFLSFLFYSGLTEPIFKIFSTFSQKYTIYESVNAQTGSNSLIFALMFRIFLPTCIYILFIIKKNQQAQNDSITNFSISDRIALSGGTLYVFMLIATVTIPTADRLKIYFFCFFLILLSQCLQIFDKFSLMFFEILIIVFWGGVTYYSITHGDQSAFPFYFFWQIPVPY